MFHYNLPKYYQLCEHRFHGVVVITSALHAEGREFEPRWNLYFFQKCKHFYTIAEINISVTWSGNFFRLLLWYLHVTIYQWTNPILLYSFKQNQEKIKLSICIILQHLCCNIVCLYLKRFVCL